MKFLLFLLALTGYKCYGQDTVTKHIIIDTMVLDDGLNASVRWDFSFLKRVNDRFVSFENNFWNTAYSPSLNCTVKFTDKSDLAVGFLIDNNDGSLELRHLENLGDTIHLSSYRIYNNHLFDSVITSFSYYHHLNDTTSVFHKGKVKTDVPKNACDTLKQVLLKINGKNYFVPIKFSSVIRVANYCNGYARKRDEHRRNKYEYFGKRKKRRIKFKTFSGSVVSYRYRYFGRLDFR